MERDLVRDRFPFTRHHSFMPPKTYRVRKIEWLREICGEEPEVLQGREPLPAVPGGIGDLAVGRLNRAYNKGQQTRVQVLESEDPCRLLDVDRGHEVSRIPHDAFRYLD
jgi:hypothetical protein